MKKGIAKMKSLLLYLEQTLISKVSSVYFFFVKASKALCKLFMFVLLQRTLHLYTVEILARLQLDKQEH